MTLPASEYVYFQGYTDKIPKITQMSRELGWRYD